MYGWTGKILRVDLTNRKATPESDTEYADKFIGGVGFGAKLYYDEVPADITAFDPKNKLYFMPGPVAGTFAPSSGRCELMGKAPQPYPVQQYCRSGAGGSFGPELKFAGYDGVVIEGKADKPVYLWIQDDKVEFRDAKDIWGWGTFITNTMIRAELGQDIQIAAIGQAGENLVVASSINVGRNAFGQGGFGAVMGSKNLKAIAVKGTGSIPVAKPDELMDLWFGTRNYLSHRPQFSPLAADAKAPDGLGPYGYKRMACSAGCPGGCVDAAAKVPSPAGGLNEAFYRCSTNVRASPDTPQVRSSLRGIGNDWGLNLYEVGLGIGAWLRFVANAGYIKDIGGVVPTMIPITSPMHPSKDPVDYQNSQDLNSYESVYAIMKTIAFKEGDLGKVLAKGALRAADELGFGKEFLQICFHKDGFNDHCGSRWSHNHHFPFWIWAALTRATYCRDTGSSMVHGLCHLEDYAKEYGGQFSWDQMNEAAQHMWGEPAFTKDYKNKERTGYWFEIDTQFCCSLVICDWLYRYLRIGPPNGLGMVTTPRGKTYEANHVPHLIYNYVTGMSIDKEEQLKIGERIFNLERAIYMREGYIGRKGGWYTKADEAVIPYFTKWGDVYDKIHMDANEFRALLDRYYAVAGWDIQTGMPTRAKYEGLGLKYVADGLAKIGKLP